jgi:hypothetical protein
MCFANSFSQDERYDDYIKAIYKDTHTVVRFEYYRVMDGEPLESMKHVSSIDRLSVIESHSSKPLVFALNELIKRTVNLRTVHPPCSDDDILILRALVYLIGSLWKNQS